MWCFHLVSTTQHASSTLFAYATGFQYVRRNDLPQGTISITNQNLTIIDSSFTNLAAFGQASIILQNSAVIFDNCSFIGNYQSNAGAINVNQTSNATILNSVFVNNFGYQAGAIAVGCKPPTHPLPPPHPKAHFKVSTQQSCHALYCASVMRGNTACKGPPSALARVHADCLCKSA